ncbi:hypothetical protein HJB53_16355 [Rhizobium lentis]|uniref:hypothetical protein n=1 Tax=Rhizobium lentis TaxID=1138194 RepID=UPI001C83DAC9|nr:hypothetical protein [Rhizobium lentis]MBX4985579.1 hypothetical protein [Rhizobium lentis]MBX5034367.1 hypothetical protein [Rhizobium lentis]MBX5128087.1 hypothetical protein [Rhizobium lentis]
MNLVVLRRHDIAISRKFDLSDRKIISEKAPRRLPLPIEYSSISEKMAARTEGGYTGAG